MNHLRECPTTSDGKHYWIAPDNPETQHAVCEECGVAWKK